MIVPPEQKYDTFNGDSQGDSMRFRGNVNRHLCGIPSRALVDSLAAQGHNDRSQTIQTFEVSRV